MVRVRTGMWGCGINVELKVKLKPKPKPKPTDARMQAKSIAQWIGTWQKA